MRCAGSKLMPSGSMPGHEKTKEELQHLRSDTLQDASTPVDGSMSWKKDPTPVGRSPAAYGFYGFVGLFVLFVLLVLLFVGFVGLVSVWFVFFFGLLVCWFYQWIVLSCWLSFCRDS